MCKILNVKGKLLHIDFRWKMVGINNDQFGVPLVLFKSHIQFYSKNNIYNILEIKSFIVIQIFNKKF